MQLQKSKGKLQKVRSPAKYVVGIDLGTTNSAVSFVPIGGLRSEIESLSVIQRLSELEVGPHPSLPSFLYIPGQYDLPQEAPALEGEDKRRLFAGVFARAQGALVPGRLVSSAKSWLCHEGVDRMEDILPWGAPEDVRRVSPVEASAAYLARIRASFDQRFPKTPLADQDVIVTIPASFDDAARELTIEAAKKAGIATPLLIEEPVAALYNALSHHKDLEEFEARDSELILVIDIGGGTTDFSLVGARRSASTVEFQRLAVGRHLLLGGDNMDRTLASNLEKEHFGGEPGRRFSQRQWGLLIEQCRMAKERLLSRIEDLGSSGEGLQSKIEDIEFTIVGEGSSIFGGALSFTLATGVVKAEILDGFFPIVPAGEPLKQRKGGLKEWGLPYEHDPAITRHLSDFLRRHADDQIIRQFAEFRTVSGLLKPDAILFNGGVFHAGLLRERLSEVLASWFGEGGTRVIENFSYDHAVALGATYYGLSRRGEGIKIKSGCSHTYYIVVERDKNGNDSETPLPPGEGGAPAPGEGNFDQSKIHAVCLLPRGTEADKEIELRELNLELLTNTPVQFELLASDVRVDEPGKVVALDPEEAHRLPPLHTIIRHGKKKKEKTVPVALGAYMTEVGTLSMWCEALEGGARYELAFNLREVLAFEDDFEEGAESREQGAEILDSRSVVLDPDDEEADYFVDDRLLASVFGLIDSTFGGSGTPTDQQVQLAQSLAKKIEETLRRKRNSWPAPVLRKIADRLIRHLPARRRHPVFEERWLNLTGFCMRPGFGFPGDKIRVDRLREVFDDDVGADAPLQIQTELWIFWRRVAAGLDKERQLALYSRLKGEMVLIAGAQKNRFGKWFKALGADPVDIERLRALASLERIDPETKKKTGNKVLGKYQSGARNESDLFALTRLAAREPFHAAPNVVVPVEAAERWIRGILESEAQIDSEAKMFLIEAARLTNDRGRDIDFDLRGKVIAALERASDEDEL
ncbi:MAG: hsp70 family protein, partial [Planctomycetes bacterium]|nr:hsp70 family protein [Planctomycetota bacterium]